MKSNPTARRSFLRNTGLAAAGVALTPRSWARVIGANDDVRLAFVGLNGRGAGLLKTCRLLKGTRVVALCDVNSDVLDRAALGLRDRGESLQTFADLRDLLARPDIDAVVIATPHHQHALQAVWACQAGKDVYVEKPVSHNIWEGRQLVAAAKTTGRVVQSGLQSRSRGPVKEAIAWVQAGNLGRITAAHGLCYKRRASIGRTVGPQTVPPTVNYDLWLGPAPRAPLRRRNLNYDWHWQWATGNGDLGNQGVHEMDIARWFLGERSVAPRIVSVGGRFGYDDDGETPNTQVVMHEYARAPLFFEVRGLPAAAATEKMDAYRGASVGVVVKGEGGSVVVDARSVQAFDRAGRPTLEFKADKTDFLLTHLGNFIEGVRSRKVNNLHCPIEEGHLSSALCHAGNISHRLGHRAGPDELRERAQGHSGLADAFGRMREHLVANGVDPTTAPATWGATLAFDAATERFVGNNAANALLSREYRQPFAVPALA